MNPAQKVAAFLSEKKKNQGLGQVVNEEKMNVSPIKLPDIHPLNTLGTQPKFGNLKKKLGYKAY